MKTRIASIKPSAWIYSILIGLFLIFSLLYRLSYFIDSPYHADAMMDYLVANHIVSFNEFPARGELFSFGFRSSPLYYYIIAAFLTIRNSPQFLAFVSIITECISLLIFSITVAYGFNPRVALLVLLIRTVTPISLSQSNIVIWPTIIAKPFFSLSLLTLLASFKRRSVKYLVVSLFTLIVAADIYPLYVFAIPPAIILSILYFRPKSIHTKYVLFSGIILFLTFIMLILSYIPRTPHTVIAQIFEILQRINYSGTLTNIPVIAEHFRATLAGFTIYRVSLFSSIVIGFILIRTKLLYLNSRNTDNAHKTILLTLSAYIVFYLICLSFISTGTSTGENRYFIPITGSTILILCVLIDFVLTNFRVARFLGLGTVLFLLVTNITSAWEKYPSQFTLETMGVNIKNKFFWQEYPWIAAIAKEVTTIQRAEAFPHKNFFSVTVDFNKEHWNDAIVWGPLERKLNTRFTYIHQTGQRDYELFPTSNNYMFFLCNTLISPESPNSSCETADTLKSNIWNKLIYKDDRISVYLIKS